MLKCFYACSNSYTVLSISSGSDKTFDIDLIVLLARLPIANRVIKLWLYTGSLLE